MTLLNVNRILVVYSLTFILFPLQVFTQSPGSIDLNFGKPKLSLGDSSRCNFTVNAIIKQEDGKYIVAGDFNSYNNVPFKYKRIVRLNADKSIDSTFITAIGVDNNSGFNAGIKHLALQPDGKILVSGLFSYFNGRAVNGLARLHTNGSIDSTFNYGSDSSGPVVVTINNKILVGGKGIKRLNENGSLDTSFNATIIDGIVNTIALQSDNKILIGGNFNFSSRHSLARLLDNGSLDTSFPTVVPASGYGVNGTVNSIAVETGGNIYIGGDFLKSADSISHRGIARIRTDGFFDETFNIGNGFSYFQNNSYSVNTIAIQPDGKIVAGGKFLSFDGDTLNNIVRINTNGKRDLNFRSGDGFNGELNVILADNDNTILAGGTYSAYRNTKRNYITQLTNSGILTSQFQTEIGFNSDGSVLAIELQPDGKIIAGGFFNSYDGVYSKGICRLLKDGTFDTTFLVSNSINSIAYSQGVYSILAQPDGKIIAAGNFTSQDSKYHCIMRFNQNGEVDTSFKSNISLLNRNAEIRAMVLQADGKIIVGGSFSSFYFSQKNILRLNTDGTPDNSYQIGNGTNQKIHAIVLQPDAKIVIRGNFYDFNGTSCSGGIIRLNSNGSTDPSFSTNVFLGPSSDDKNIVKIQKDGKLITNDSYGIKRLNTDGSVDNTFSLGYTNSTFYDFALQSDDKIIIAGQDGYIDEYINGVTVRRLITYIARLQSNGKVDTSFQAQTNSNAQFFFNILIQPNQQILAGGGFAKYGGYIIKNFLRINSGTVINTCNNNNINLTSSVSGMNYKWQVDTGSGYTDISDNVNYSGSQTPTLIINNIPSAWYGYQYRCMVNNDVANTYAIHFVNTWNGNVDTHWENPSNWDCGQIPDSNTDVIIKSGNVMTNSNIAIRTLIINNAANLTIGSNKTFLITH